MARAGASRTTNRLRWAAGGTLVATGMVVIALWSLGFVDEGSFGREAATGFLQLFGLVLVAGVIAVAVDQYQADRSLERDVERRKDELLLRMRNDAVAAYHDVKQARRLIRARIWDTSGADNLLDAATYDEQLAVINNAQLRFEALALETAAIDDPRVDKAVLKGQLDKIESYLGELVKEYETQRHNVARRQASMDALGRLSAFIDEAQVSFKRDVSAPADEAVKSLQNALQQPLTPAD